MSVCVYLAKTALSLFASPVLRRVLLLLQAAAPVVSGVATVSMETDWVLSSSSSLSELPEEDVSEATSGAFLATHTLHTHAEEEEGGGGQQGKGTCDYRKRTTYCTMYCFSNAVHFFSF